jgi:hypothetical protein
MTMIRKHSFALCSLISVGALTCLAAEPATKGSRDIPVAVLQDKVRGGLLGEILGDLNGLKHEMRYIAEPGNVQTYVPELPQGAWTDDDTDIEWVYVLEMQRSKELMLPPHRIAELWKRHINNSIWASHQYVRQLLDIGIEPLPDLKQEPALLRKKWKQEIERTLANDEPVGLARAAYLAICMDLAPVLRRNHPEQWAKAIAALQSQPKVMQALFYEAPMPAGDTLRAKAVAAGLVKPAKKIQLWIGVPTRREPHATHGYTPWKEPRLRCSRWFALICWRPLSCVFPRALRWGNPLWKEPRPQAPPGADDRFGNPPHLWFVSRSRDNRGRMPDAQHLPFHPAVAGSAKPALTAEYSCALLNGRHNSTVINNQPSIS